MFLPFELLKSHVKKTHLFGWIVKNTHLSLSIDMYIIYTNNGANFPKNTINQVKRGTTENRTVHLTQFQYFSKIQLSLLSDFSFILL